MGLLLPAALILGVSGAIAALGDTLFPATSFAEGVRQEFSDTAHFLLRLRLFHPALSLCFAAYVLAEAVPRIRRRITCESRDLAWVICGTLAVQLAIGGLNVLLLAPIWIQIVHLLLADVLWVLLVLFVAEG